MYYGRVKRLHRSDLVREPLCREHWYRQNSGDSTHHCLGPTPTLNGCDLPPSTRTQFSVQEYSYLMASKRHQSTPFLPQHSQNVSWGTRQYTFHTFPRSTKHVYTSLACSQDFSKICWRVEICSAVLRQQRTGYHPALVQLFSWHHGMRSSWETKQRDAAVVGSFTPVFLFVFKDDQFANLP